MEPGRVRLMSRQLNDENLLNRVGKPVTKPMAAIQKRPAFGEVGNKITLPSAQNVGLKNGLLSQKPPVTVKPTLGLQKQPIKKDSVGQRPLPVIAEQKTTKGLVGSSTTSSVAIRKPVALTQKPVALSQKPAALSQKPVPLSQKSVALSHKPVALPPKPFARNAAIKKPAMKKIEEESKTEETKAYSLKHMCGIIDVDKSVDNPLLVAEYIQDIMGYLMATEKRYQIADGYLTQDHKTSASMRSVLVNWMVEVHVDFNLLTETFHLAVGYLDRFLQVNRTIGREFLQLVGISALLVAAKYEEIYIPFELSDLVYISDDSFTKKQILDMECAMLKSLNFCMGRPISLQFLRRYNKIANAPPTGHILGKYLLELALLEYNICHVDPSLQAAAACCLSMAILKESSNPETLWTTTLIHYSTYSYLNIVPIMHEFAQALLRAETTKYPAVKVKYSSSKFGQISMNPKLKSILVRTLAKKAKLLK